MKAEHRRELHTNALADRMGRMVQQVKSGPSRRAILWIVVAVVVVAVWIGLTIYWNNKRATMSSLWTDVGDGNLTIANRQGTISANPWLTEYKDSNPALAARFQIAWTILWDQGLRNLANPQSMKALESISRAEVLFKDLAEECKDDPVLGPEAAYALAVIEETRAVGGRPFLDKALTMYKGVQSKYKDSAAGKAAGERAQYIEKNRAAVEDFYLAMDRSLPLLGAYQALKMGKQKLPEGLPEKE
jgi:hypothetical protein